MKKYLLLLIVSVAFLLLSAYSYVNAVSNNLANSIFRLHSSWLPYKLYEYFNKWFEY